MNKDNILLINPPQSFKHKFGEERNYVPPLGLLYLNEYLIRGGFNSAVIDMDAKEYAFDDIYKLIEDRNVDVVGMSVFTRTRRIPYYLSGKIRERYPDIYLMLGGAHCTIAPEDAQQNNSADVIVRGEAELDICRIVARKEKGIVECNSPTNLNELYKPRKDVDYIERNYGKLLNMKFSKVTTAVSSSRGCPLRCTFCSRVGLMKFRYRTPEDVVEEIKQLYDQGYDGIIFNDDNFTAIPERAMRIAELIKKEKLKMDFAFQGMAIPDDEFWRTMSSANFCVVCTGIEHIKPEIVRYFNKHPHPEEWKDRVAKTLRLINKYNIFACGSFILGAPMETRQDAKDLIDFLDEQKVDLKNGNELLFAYGTQLWKDAVKEGLFPSNVLHTKSSEVFPEKKEYLSEIFDLAWRKSAFRLPRALRKMAICHKNDKLTPISSLLKWVMKANKDFFTDGPAQGYGRKKESRLQDEGIID